jgi:hypothetical protein
VLTSLGPVEPLLVGVGDASDLAVDAVIAASGIVHHFEDWLRPRPTSVCSNRPSSSRNRNADLPGTLLLRKEFDRLSVQPGKSHRGADAPTAREIEGDNLVLGHAVEVSVRPEP